MNLHDYIETNYEWLEQIGDSYEWSTFDKITKVQEKKAELESVLKQINDSLDGLFNSKVHSTMINKQLTDSKQTILEMIDTCDFWDQRLSDELDRS